MEQTEAITEGVTQSVLSLTLEEVITLVVSIVASIIAIVSAVIVWIKTPAENRTLSTLDESVAAHIGTLSGNESFMSSLEHIVDGLNMTYQEIIRDSNQAVFQAAQWIPGKADNALAQLYIEATDGISASEKSNDATDRDDTKELPKLDDVTFPGAGNG